MNVDHDDVTDHAANGIGSSGYNAADHAAHLDAEDVCAAALEAVNDRVEYHATVDVVRDYVRDISAKGVDALRSNARDRAKIFLDLVLAVILLEEPAVILLKHPSLSLSWRRWR